MKPIKILVIVAVLCTLTACFGGRSVVTDTYTPEESGLNMVKLTEESNNSVCSPIPVSTNAGWAQKSSMGYCKEAKYGWTGYRTLSISPDGTMLAYVSNINKQKNVMIRRTGAQGASTQRTFRDVTDFTWGPDNRLYFADRSSSTGMNARSYICSINAEAGSMMTQITNGSVYDKNPVTADGKTVFFTRDNYKDGPFIWSLNLEDGTLTSCARGFMPCLIPGETDAFYCVRNSAEGRSEIWYVNYEKGQETMLISDAEHSFTNPSLSPDGRWIVMQGNTISSKNKKSNLDIYVMRTDGSGLTQITYSPSIDTCPVFSPDGKYIYFLSDRGNKDESFNIWRMNFRMD